MTQTSVSRLACAPATDQTLWTVRKTFASRTGPKRTETRSMWGPKETEPFRHGRARRRRPPDPWFGRARSVATVGPAMRCPLGSHRPEGPPEVVLRTGVSTERRRASRPPGRAPGKRCLGGGASRRRSPTYRGWPSHASFRVGGTRPAPKIITRTASAEGTSGRCFYVRGAARAATRPGRGRAFWDFSEVSPQA